jgi:hypothetical protein
MYPATCAVRMRSTLSTRRFDITRRFVFDMASSPMRMANSIASDRTLSSDTATSSSIKVTPDCAARRLIAATALLLQRQPA